MGLVGRGRGYRRRGKLRHNKQIQVRERQAMAYYSNTGAQIFSGAAGLGQNRGGPLTAFRDGSLGRNWGSSPRAFQDGSLGGSGPLMSFKDGSLGMPLFLETQEGIRQLEEPAVIRHGMGEYFSGMAGCRGCGVGQADLTVTPTIDLSDPSTALEVKQAIAIAPWMTSTREVPEAMADVDNPVWTTMTVQLIGAWISGYVEFMYAQENPPAVPKVEFMDTLIAEAFEGEFFVPNALGIRNIYFGATIGATSVGGNPAEAFPKMTFFIKAQDQAQTTGSVLPPAIEGETTKGSMVAIGLGVAAVALVGVAFFGKKKKK